MTSIEPSTELGILLTPPWLDPTRYIAIARIPNRESRIYNRIEPSTANPGARCARRAKSSLGLRLGTGTGTGLAWGVFIAIAPAPAPPVSALSGVSQAQATTVQVHTRQASVKHDDSTQAAMSDHRNRQEPTSPLLGGPVHYSGQRLWLLLLLLLLTADCRCCFYCC